MNKVWIVVAGVVVATVVVLGLMAAPVKRAQGGGVLKVVAAENFWGSLAAQLGGSRVAVTSIVTNPNTDPHDYEPTAADSRNLAEAKYVIVNGVGYDPWATKLVAAGQSGGTLLNVGNLVGVAPGGNPHLWYSPSDVRQVIAQITSDYKKLDPADAAYFDQQKAAYEQMSLMRYTTLVHDIQTKYAGVPVGASESICAPLAQALGLNLITPASFLDAMSEGSDPTAADKTAVDRQITSKAIKVYVYNSQNSTPDVTRQVEEARAAGIPVVSVTETLTPANASFQDWQTRQLQSLETALAQAVGR